MQPTFAILLLLYVLVSLPMLLGPQPGFSHLRSQGFSNLLPNGIPTNISNNNLKGSRQYDNLWINQHTARRFRGAWGVVRDGLLLHNETVSDHCLVWADFAV